MYSQEEIQGLILAIDPQAEFSTEGEGVLRVSSLVSEDIGADLLNDSEACVSVVDENYLIVYFSEGK